MSQLEHDVEDRFRCPECLGTLTTQRASAACSQCGRAYARHDGILDFRCHRRDYYFNPVPRDAMSRLVESAPSMSWDAMVREFVRHVKSVPGWVDNLTVNGRYSWKLFLDLPEDARFLDFGCGLGALTQNIAPHVREVVALDLTWERLRFAQQRFAKFNPDDRITVVAGGDGRHLPFADAQFDCIALSGVLEWIADNADGLPVGSRLAKLKTMVLSFFGESNPRRTQQRFLEELRRILKPGGQLFVAIENRWGYEYFAGRPDHHSGLLFGSLLPRFAANLYSIARNRRPYRTYTHSFPGARRLFRAAGFSRQELYGLTPGYSSLAEIIPAWTDQPIWASAASARSTKLKRSAWFVPAFGIVAQPEPSRHGVLVARLLAHVARQAATAPITLDSCEITGKDKVVLKGSTGAVRVILKLPADAASRAGEANHRHTIDMLERRELLGGLVPKLLASGTFQGLAYAMERAVEGAPLASVALAQARAAIAPQVADLVMRLGSVASEPMAIDPGTGIHERLVATPLAKLAAAGANAAHCAAFGSRIDNALANGRWRSGIQHGDLSTRNLFVANGAIAGIIDWEHANEHGLPVLDMIGYLESRQRLADPASTVTDNLLRLARFDWPCVEELTELRGLYAHFGIDASRHDLLCRLAWLAHVDSQLDTVVRFDPRFLERIVAPMLGGAASH